AVVLWVLGSGSIQGFAITLFIGVVVSLFTALVLTRAFLKLSANILKVSPKLYGVSAKKGGNN
ncbi:MAG: protein translocase subunit SecD, partial [Clostridia bacterium]|nr:protein translocase subunit SecD [Clostridia bacterium]